MRLLVGLPFFRTGRLRWTPFASAEPTPANIRRHYRDYLRRQGKADKFDQRRLDATTALPYVDWWVPEEGFGGFDAYGNAAYVVDADQGDWQNMTKRGRSSQASPNRSRTVGRTGPRR